MAYLLELAGIHQPEIRRIIRRKGGPRKDPNTTTATATLSATLPTQDQPTQMQAPHKGQQLDSYELEQRLGRGASAEVWRAKLVSKIAGVNLNASAIVALKIYSASLLEGFQPLRLHREFSIAANITHAHLARVYDLLISPNRPSHTFMAMEYIDGPTLKQHIATAGKLPPLRVAQIGIQLFSALEELHSLGALHRDVKAANIMLSGRDSDASIKLVDLGIVALTTDERLTAASVFLGSKHSAPLEQLTGQQLDARTDIYGAGSVLFHCLKGAPMYAGAGPEGAIVLQMMTRPAQLPSSLARTAAQRELIEFVNRCISVEQAARPDDAQACVTAIRGIESRLAAEEMPSPVERLGAAQPAAASDGVRSLAPLGTAPRG